VVDDWGLPALFSEVCLHFGVRIPETLEWPEARDYLRLLACTCRIADVLVAESSMAGALWPAARESMIALGLGLEDCQRTYDEISDEWHEWGRMLQVPAHAGERAQDIETRSRQAEQEPAATGATPRGLRILAVDDDPVQLRITVTLLQREGHEVTVARNGSEAWPSPCSVRRRWSSRTG
jgi:hypothetical protein